MQRRGTYCSDWVGALHFSTTEGGVFSIYCVTVSFSPFFFLICSAVNCGSVCFFKGARVIWWRTSCLTGWASLADKSTKLSNPYIQVPLHLFPSAFLPQSHVGMYHVAMETCKLFQSIGCNATPIAKKDTRDWDKFQKLLSSGGALSFFIALSLYIYVGCNILATCESVSVQVFL